MSVVTLKAGTLVHQRALLLVLGLILLSTAAVILFVIGPQRKRAAVETWRGRLSAMADDRRAAIERWIDDAEDDAALVAGGLEVREAVLAGAAPGGGKANGSGRGLLLDAILTSVTSSHHCRSVWVLDGKGRVVGTARGSAPLAPDEADIGRRSAAKNERVLDIVNYDGSADIVVAAPVPGGAGGTAAGAIALELDPEGFLFPILRSEPTPSRTAETLLIRPEGEDVLFLSPLRFRSDQPASFRLPLATPGLAGRQAVSGPESFGEFVDYRGVPVFAAIRRLRNVPWGLVAKVDVAEALSGYRTEVWGIAAIFGLLVVSVSAVGFAFWRRESSVFESSLTDSHARQQAMAEALQAVVAASPLAIFTVDYDARVGMWNAAAGRIFGWSEEEVRGQPVPFVPKGGERVFESLRSRVRLGESLAGVELWLRRKDGTPIDVSLWTAPLRDAEGRIVGAMAEIADITERKRDEKAHRAAEERYRAIFDAAGLGIVQADAEGRFVNVNPAFCRILGRDRADVVGKSWAELTHADDLAQNRALFEAMQRGERDRYDLIKHFLRSDGSPVVTNVVVTAVAGAEGARSYIGLIEDVTESRKLEEQFRQVQKMEAVGRLAGGVAHDFNNLLTVITGYSELLGSRLAPESPERESLAEIEKASERATGLTRQLLAFSRRQVLQSKPVDLNAVVSEMEKMLRRMIGEDVELVTRLSAGAAVVVADRGQLEQVLMNLLVNARDAMPKGGRLTVEVSRFEVRMGDPIAAAEEVPPGPWVALTVTDTGHGIPPEIHEHLFEPFFTTKETGKGTGLGLATVYGIVKQSGGNIWAENAPGGGATFRALFPSSDAHPGANPESASVKGGHTGSETILLVEDEPAVRAVARSILKGCGYTLIEAENGAAALELAARHPGTIHLLLTDVVMPGMGGRDVAEQMRRVRPEIRVLFSSGYAAEAGLTDILATQGFAYLSKPFSPAQLAEAVREVLDTP